MKLIRNAFAASVLAAVSVVACSSQHGTTGTGPGSTGQIGSLNGNTGSGSVGSVGMHLAIANGVVLQLLNWTITGTGLPTYTGNVPIGDAQSIETIIGGIQAGGPYTITFTGNDSQNDPCTGSGTFSIIAGATSSATVAITCTQPADASLNADVTTGNVLVDAGVTVVTAAAYHCPGISSFSINPAEILSPQTAALAVQTVVTPGGTPGTATINWTTTGGTFVDTNSTTSQLASPTFNCGAFTGNALVTVTIGLTGSDNGVDAGDVCASATNQTISGTIVCETGGSLVCVGTTPNICGAGTDGGTPFCTNLQTNPSTCGTCTTVCPAAETCQAGACACPTAGQTLCGTACTSTATDVNNCGTCGNVCATGDSCIAGACKAAPPTVCTTAGQTNCISCSGQTGGTCSATDAIFVQIDINQGVATTAGADPAGSCYACLLSGSCLDNVPHHVTGRECGDLPSDAGLFTSGAAPDGGPGVTGTDSALCLANLTCVTGTQGAGCALNTAGITNCYCGSGGGSPTNCETNGASANGACFSAEVDGFRYAATDGTDIVSNFTDTTEPSGMANQIYTCAIANSCTSCL
jgi:hypothetical protein